MAKYKAYPEYKDSGVEWLKSTPAHWSSAPIKYLALATNSLFLDGDWIESKDISDDGVRYITTGNVGEGLYKEQGSGFITENTFSKLNCTEVFEGDILISRLNNPIGRACLVPSLGYKTVTSVDNVIFRTDKYYNRKYLVYLFSSKDYFQHTGNLARGTTMQRISRGLLGNIRIPVPTRSEQASIAAFLDHETAKIDNLIEKQLQLIELLKEKRQAVISSVVSIRSNVMKTKLKNLVSIQTGYPFSSTKFKFSPDNSIPLLRGVNVGVDCIKWEDVVYWDVCALDRLSDYLLTAGDIVFGMDRPWISSGARVSEIKEQDLPCLLLQRVARIRSNIKSYQPFIKLCLSSNEFREYAEIDLTGVSVPHISPEQISDFYVRDIPFDDQVYLTKEALEKIGKIQITQEMVEQTIQILQERRTALISAAVTGKIDVRDWVAPDTQDVEEPQEATA